MRKGIAVETTIKLIVCMIALVIIVYLIYRYVLGSPLSERECAARMTAWCVQCQIANWEGGTKMGDDLGKCAIKYWGFGGETQICNKEYRDTHCKAFLPSTK